MKSLNQCRVNVMVTDMDRAADFYSNTLELDCLNRYGNHYAEISANGFLIGLHPSSGKVITGNSVSIGFGVTEFDDAVHSLKDKNVDIKIETEGYIRLAHFTDPDQNPLYLAENKV